MVPGNSTSRQVVPVAAISSAVSVGWRIHTGTIMVMNRLVSLIVVWLWKFSDVRSFT